MTPKRDLLIRILRRNLLETQDAHLSIIKIKVSQIDSDESDDPMFYLPLEHSRLQSQLPPPPNSYLACTNRYRVSTGNHDASRCTKPTPRRICYVYQEWALDRWPYSSIGGMSYMKGEMKTS